MWLYLAPAAAGLTRPTWPARASTHTLTCGRCDPHRASVATWFSSQPAIRAQPELMRSTAHRVCQWRRRLHQDTYLSFLSRHFTKIGRIPDFIKSSMGGFLSLDSSFLEKRKSKYMGISLHTKTQPLCVCCFILSPGRLHSTELDNRVNTRRILWRQEYMGNKH